MLIKQVTACFKICFKQQSFVIELRLRPACLVIVKGKLFCLNLLHLADSLTLCDRGWNDELIRLSEYWNIIVKGLTWWKGVKTISKCGLVDTWQSMCQGLWQTTETKQQTNQKRMTKHGCTHTLFIGFVHQLHVFESLAHWSISWRYPVEFSYKQSGI